MYVYYVFPGAFLNSLAMQNVFYCSGLESTAIGLFQGAASNLAFLLALVLLVSVFDLGFQGVCIASSFQFACRWIASEIFMRTVKNPKISEHLNEPFFSLVTLQDLGYQAKLALTQCSMGVWNWWGLEVFTLMAGYVSVTAFAAQTVLRAVSQLVYMIPVGMRLAVTIKLGKLVGVQDPEGCRHFYAVSIYLILIFAAIAQTLLRIFDNSVFYAFTNDAAVIAEIDAAWNVFLVFVLFDQLQGIASAGVIATGRQYLGGLITWIGYFFIGLSIISFNVFYRDSRLIGIWFGAIAAVGFNSAAFLLASCTANWERVVEEAAARRAREKSNIQKTDDESQLRHGDPLRNQLLPQSEKPGSIQ